MSTKYRVISGTFSQTPTLRARDRTDHNKCIVFDVVLTDYEKAFKVWQSENALVNFESDFCELRIIKGGKERPLFVTEIHFGK